MVNYLQESFVDFDHDLALMPVKLLIEANLTAEISVPNHRDKFLAAALDGGIHFFHDCVHKARY